jgi:hypothetical protein
MSTEILEQQSSGHEISLTQYWGGDEHGVCIQVTGKNCDRETGCVGLTAAEALFIGRKLIEWSRRVSK